MSARSLLDNSGKINSFYLPSYIPNDLQSPVIIQANAPGTSGNPSINVDGNTNLIYGGSFTLNPGSNAVAGGAGVGVNIKSIPCTDGVSVGCAVEVGTDGNTGATGPHIENHLYIAGRYGLSEVNDGIYNPPISAFVNYNPGTFTSTPEAINNASLANSIRTIPLGNTPAGYNFYKMFLDVDTTLAYNEAAPLIRIYLSDTENGAYDEDKAIVSWVQPETQPSGDPISIEDIPLIYYGVPTGSNLYVNITFANDPLPDPINANFSQTTTDYSIEASKVSPMA